MLYYLILEHFKIEIISISLTSERTHIHTTLSIHSHHYHCATANTCGCGAGFLVIPKATCVNSVCYNDGFNLLFINRNELRTAMPLV